MPNSSTPSALLLDRKRPRPSRWIIISSTVMVAASTLAGPGPVLDDVDHAGETGRRRAMSVLSLPNSSGADSTAVLNELPSSVDIPPPLEAAGDAPSISAAPAGPTHRIARRPTREHFESTSAAHVARELARSPIRQAIATMEACLTRYAAISDYTCVFSKRERIDGQLSPVHVMSMKFRTKPSSVYLRFVQPGAGREAIYINGRNNGKVLAHDIGINKILAGTLWLDPSGSMAMEDNRHPITEAGIGPLIQTVLSRWNHELSPGESIVALSEHSTEGSKPGTVIETTHPERGVNFMFHKVRVTIDRELGLPVRFEAYDWPDAAGSAPKLVEEYSYAQIKLNVGLSDKDFDVNNAEYAFGRL